MPEGKSHRAGKAVGSCYLLDGGGGEVTISGVLRECGASFGSAGDYGRAKRSLMDCLARLMWPPEPCL